MLKRTINPATLLVMTLMLMTLALGGCGTKTVAPQTHPDWWFKGEIVDTDYVAQFAKVPHPKNAMIIDSRPYKTKFVQGYIPTAVNIPFKDFDKKIDMLPKDKSATLIFYCGGVKCSLSHKSATKAVKLGYTNVKVYAAGYPAWLKSGRPGALTIEGLSKKIASGENYMLIDARPAKMYLEGSIPSAIGIPDSKFAKKTGMLPADKSVELIYFCGGYACSLSHKSAKKAQDLGYTNVVIAEAGYPGWKKMYGGAAAVAVQSGEEEGAIDLTQFRTILKDSPDSIRLIDVRDADEFAAGHLPGAENITVDALEKMAPELKVDKPIVFVCATGARSGEAYYMIRDMRPDIKEVYYVEAEVTYDDNGGYTIKKQ